MDYTSLTISNNIIEVRDALGLSQNDFAMLSNISVSTLVNIESGKKSFRIKTINGITEFTTIKLEQLSKVDFKPPKNFRETLTDKYKSVPSKYVLLSKEPTIPYCIKYKLLPTTFLNTPKETNDIKHFFTKMGWNFKANSIHTALKRMPLLIKIIPHQEKKGTNQYQKIK